MSFDIATFAVTATVVTRADVSDALVHDTLENLAGLAAHTDLLSRLDADYMQGVGITAPLHPGAAAAFATFSGQP